MATGVEHSLGGPGATGRRGRGRTRGTPVGVGVDSEECGDDGWSPPASDSSKDGGGGNGNEEREIAEVAGEVLGRDAIGEYSCCAGEMAIGDSTMGVIMSIRNGLDFTSGKKEESS